MSFFGQLVLILVLTSCGFGKVSMSMPAKKAQINKVPQLEEKLFSLHIHYMMREQKKALLSSDTSDREFHILNFEIKKREGSLLEILAKKNPDREGFLKELKIFAGASKARHYSMTQLMEILKEAKAEGEMDSSVLIQEINTLKKTREYQVFEKNIEHLSYVSAVDSKTPTLDRI